jgi:hypothetical protein
MNARRYFRASAGPSIVARLAFAAEAVCCLTTLPAAAQGASAASGGWKHTVVVYALGAGMSGEASVGSLDADVDLSLSEILENLEAGGMLAYRGERGNWAVTANAVFIGLGATKDLPIGTSAEVDFDELVVEVDGSWRFAKRWELYFGLRAVDIDATLEVRPVFGSNQTASASKKWVDPLVGLRLDVPMGEKWMFVGRGDVGGFGVGSDLAWQATAHFDWRISKHCGATFGYIALDMDYEDGEGSDFFRYDILAAGPFAGATFTF